MTPVPAMGNFKTIIEDPVDSTHPGTEVVVLKNSLTEFTAAP
jgi:hypothetical protein